jgi:hypothetical protein
MAGIKHKHEEEVYKLSNWIEQLKESFRNELKEPDTKICVLCEPVTSAVPPLGRTTGCCAELANQGGDILSVTLLRNTLYMLQGEAFY